MKKIDVLLEFQKNDIKNCRIDYQNDWKETN